MKVLQQIANEGVLDKSEAELSAIREKAVLASVSGQAASAPSGIYRQSLFRIESGGSTALVCMAQVDAAECDATAVIGPSGGGSLQKRLFVVSKSPVKLGFFGPHGSEGGIHYQEVVPGAANLGPLWEHLPWTKPKSLRNEQTTIGMGDRIGMATAGQLRAARFFDASPVLAQQSIRELDFTARSFGDVVADTAFQIFQEGVTSGYGADGDHLKTIPDIDRALAYHMPMVTLDLTEVMRPEVADWSDAEVSDAFATLPSEFRARVANDYADKTIELETTNVTLDAATARRCAVMYGDALALTERVNAHLKQRTGDKYDLEISVDETTTPTLPSHHYFISRELERRGVTVSSLAPRFIGDFQKAIDYIGEIPTFTEQFRVHAEIARATGGYKVSVHSGSDKFSVYPIVGEETQLRLHLKTSGTSWLESLRTIAQTDPELYRLMHQRAFDYFPEASKSYHITADLSTIAPLEKQADAELSAYLDHAACRQLLHISYGGLLRDPEVRERYFPALHRYEGAHYANLARHMGKHLELLGVPRRS
ncbi:MAG: tagaturonate epimerase family protein [Spirochaetales bacterium]